MSDTKAWLDRYSGQSVEELIALESTHTLGSLVVAFEIAIEQARSKRASRGETPLLTPTERTILGVEAIEREVNNGGYKQFFQNSSCEFAPTIVADLTSAGCIKTAELTQAAIDALGTTDLSEDSIQLIIDSDDEARDRILDGLDQAYYKAKLSKIFFSNSSRPIKAKYGSDRYVGECCSNATSGGSFASSCV